MGASLSGGTQKGIHFSNVMKHSTKKSTGKSGSTVCLFHQQIPLEPLFLSLALYKTTSQQCSPDPHDHFKVGKTECIFWQRIYPRFLIKRIERATGWAVDPHTIRCMRFKMLKSPIN